jgi:Fe-S-cluster containining protein
MCGECCKAGYDVYVSIKDVENWKKLKKFELLENVMVKPQCISLNNGTEFNSKQGITLNKIKKTYKNYDKKVKELIEFLQKYHDYYGTNGLREYTKTILPDLKYDPILTPKNYNVILKGIDIFKLDYVLEKDPSGKCFFLKLNRCQIHDIKPIACRKFPFTKNKCLRNDHIFESICNAYNKLRNKPKSTKMFY